MSPKCHMYSEGTWSVFAWSKSDTPWPPIQMWFDKNLTIEEVVVKVQERLDRLAVKSERHVQYTRYFGSLEMMQGGDPFGLEKGKVKS